MTPIQDVLEVLEDAGFARLPRPLTIVGTKFDFEATARGTGTSHDLVLIATNQVPPSRLQRLVAGLARSLDLAGSRRPVTIIVIGGISFAQRDELERYARVLPVTSNEPSREEIEKAVSVLLPLKLPNSDLVHGHDAINEVLGILGSDKSTSDHKSLIQPAADGPDAVREVLRLYMNEGSGWSEEATNDNE